jgi:hypothetical protein
MKLHLMLAALVAMALPAAASAGMPEDVKFLNDNWARISYQMNGSSHQAAALDKLAQQADQVVARYPGQADPLLWQGIIVSEQANRANIFHKLSLATRARYPSARLRR